MTQIKICGLSREADIDYVNEAGPDYIGFILYFPKSHRNTTTEKASELKKRLASGIKAVGVFVDQQSETVIEAARKIPLDIVQLHGHEDESYIKSVRKELNIPVWKAFRIENEDDLNAAENSTADMILLDNGYGTGKCFDWTILNASEPDRPFVLAGGLTPENITEVIRRLKPKIIDISSGVETEGKKDRQKIAAAVAAAHNDNERKKRP